MVDKELIEIWRNALKPSISLWLLNTNYEEMGEQDKEEFERDFDEILDLALIGLKHKAQLLQEGTTKGTTSDTISRQAAIELVMKYCPDDDGTVQCDGDIRELLDELENLPPAQPERKTGHWEINEHTYAGLNRKNWKCTNCCTGMYDFIFTSVCKPGWKFCPNCGADMREEKVKCGDEDTLQGGLMSAT